MCKTIRVAACQMPEIREDVDAALSGIEEYGEKATMEEVRLLCFPECFLQGYLVNSAEEHERARRQALDLQSRSFGEILRRLAHLKPLLVFGLIEREEERLFNTAVVVERGALVGRYRKTCLLAGETLFTAGTSYPIFSVDGLKFGINICYDTAFPQTTAAVAAQGAHLVLNPANNMMPYKKAEQHKEIHSEVRGERARETGLWLVSSDITGERGGRIAYGPTAIINPQGNVVAQVPLLQAGMVAFDIPLPN